MPMQMPPTIRADVQATKGRDHATFGTLVTPDAIMPQVLHEWG